jgi:Putative DNA-binding domain
MLTLEALRDYLSKKEVTNVEFKLKYVLSGQNKAKNLDEVAKDISALANSSGRGADDFAYLIIGAGDQLFPDGTRDHNDVRQFNFQARAFLDIVNARCTPALANLEYDELSLDGRFYGVLTIPPSPYIHHLSRNLDTPQGLWRRGSVLVRHGDGVAVASFDELLMMQQQREGWSSVARGSSRKLAIERVAHFHEERVAMVIAGKAPTSLSAGPRRIVHLVQMDEMELPSGNDLIAMAAKVIRPRLEEEENGQLYRHWAFRYNSDGYLAVSEGFRFYTGGYTDQDKPARRCVQVFRNGALEEIDVLAWDNTDGKRAIHSNYCEGELILSAFPRYLAIAKDLGLTPPLVVMITLLGVEGYTLTYQGLAGGAFFKTMEMAAIDKDLLSLSPIIVDDFAVTGIGLFSEALNMLWQAAGRPCSPHINDEGEWKLHPRVGL